MEDSFYVEKEATREGLPSQFNVHAQQNLGARTMANAHIHDYIEVLYGVTGEYRILLNNKEYHFTKGDLVLINSNEIHKIISLTDGLNKYIVIKFRPDMLYTTTQSFFELKYLMPFILNESNHQKIFKNEEIEFTVVPSLVQNIFDEYTEKKYGYELAIRADVFNLFLYILRSWNLKNVDLNIRQEIGKDLLNQLNGVFEYIENNFGEDITALEMAERCHLSYSYFSRVFKSIMRKNFKDYLNFVRVSRAERLLSTSSANITEIAQMTGFSTSSYFIRQFKRYKGVSPKQYRMRYLK